VARWAAVVNGVLGLQPAPPAAWAQRDPWLRWHTGVARKDVGK
jgi:hypothetical protein